MDILGILYIILSILIIAGTILIYTVRKEDLYNTFFIILSVLALITAFINFTSLPGNFLFKKIIALCLGVLAVIALLLRFLVKSQPAQEKLLLTVSAIAGVLYLFFS